MLLQIDVNKENAFLSFLANQLILSLTVIKTT